MTSSRISFSDASPKESDAVAVMTTSQNYVAFNRAAAANLFPISWDAMQEIYQIAMAQTLAALMPRRSLLELKPSVN